MAVDRTPEEWLRHLELRLEERRPAMERYDDYYAGRHPLAFATSKFKEAFGNLFSAFADNWMQIVVDAPVERLEVQGFDADDSGDAWQLWHDNALDAQAVRAHTEAVKNGVSYLLVDPEGRVYVEHPLQVIVDHDPADRRQRLAALKKWTDSSGYIYATLYLPDAVYKFVSDAPLKRSNRSKLKWVPRDEGRVDNPLEVVPIVPLENNPQLLWGGRSDLESAIPLNDAVNKLLSDMLVASEFQAFRQRVITGVEIPRDPDTGELMADTQLKGAITRYLVFEDKDVKVTELGAADLTNYVKPIETLIQHLAAQTRTPPHYLLAEMVNLSGDALQTAETGLVSRIKRKQRDFGPAWVEAVKLALAAQGKATAAPLVPLWANPEKQSIAQVADAMQKLDGIVPVEALWEMLPGTTPEQRERWKVLRGLPERTLPTEDS